MKYRTKAQLCLGFGIVFTYLLFPILYDGIAYGVPNVRLKEVYGVGAEDLSSIIVNNPQIFDEIGRMFGRIFGFFAGILPLLIGITFYRKFKKESKILLEKSGRLPRHPFHFCFGLFCLVLALNGITIVGENQVGIVTRYSTEEIIPTSWNEFLALKDDRIEGGQHFLLRSGIHWIPPLTSVLIFNLDESFSTEVPLIVPIYVYQRDPQGNIIGIEKDDEGANVVLGYYFWTSEGQKFYSTDTWTKIHYRGDYSVDVLKVKIEGKYHVENIEKYAIHVINSHYTKAQWVTNEGYRGEITNPPTIQEMIGFSVYFVMLEYMLNYKLPALIEQHNLNIINVVNDLLNHPYLIIPDFVDYLHNYHIEYESEYTSISNHFGIIWENLWNWDIKVIEEEL